MKTIPIAFVVLLLTSFSLAAGTVYVIPRDFPNIQDGIDSCLSGDTIRVEPGTYHENIDFRGKGITVASQGGPFVTVIVGKGSGSVVTFISGEKRDSHLEGFTIRNGTGHILNLDSHGGGICCFQSSPSIYNNVIKENTALFGAGISCVESACPILYGNIIKANMATFGGGVNIEDHSDPIIMNNSISYNIAEIDGGGIRCFYGASPRIWKNNIFENEAATGRGGGINCGDASPPIVENGIYQNRAERCGAGIYGTLSDSQVEGNVITFNSSVNGYGGGCNFADFSEPVITSNIIHGNFADGGGGGVNCIDYSVATVMNNIVSHNNSNYCGGGICCLNESSLTSINNTILYNTALKVGGGICSNVSSKVEINNCILWENQSATGKEIYIGRTSDPSEVSLSYSDTKGGMSGIKIVPGCTLTVGSGNISADPLFADPTSNDFHLGYDSPCRDAGDVINTSSLPLDFEGDARITPKRVDMGADEFSVHLYSVGRVVPGDTISMRVTGWPGMPVLLGIGDKLGDHPKATPHGSFYLNMPLLGTRTLGTLPPKGILIVNFQVPSSWAPGSNHPFQAIVGPWGGSNSRLTNAMVLTAE